MKEATRCDYIPDDDAKRAIRRDARRRLDWLASGSFLVARGKTAQLDRSGDGIPDLATYVSRRKRASGLRGPRPPSAAADQRACVS